MQQQLREVHVLSVPRDFVYAVMVLDIRLLNMTPVIDQFDSRLNLIINASRLYYKFKPFIVYQHDPEAVNAITIIWKPYFFCLLSI